MITWPISTEKQNFLKIFLESLINEKSPPKKKILVWAGFELGHGRLKFLHANFHTEWSMIAKHDN
jgi:hypothetical protein